MDPISLLLYFCITVPSAIFHEYMHGWMANQLGDPTARYAGRLTLNPKPHIDFIGTILLPIALFFFTGGHFLFAYAKPVPYNPYNLKNQRTGPLFVALAGPAANFILAIVFAIILRFFPVSVFSTVLSIIVYTNLALGVFNLVPIPPLDGSKLLYAILPESAAGVKAFLDRFGFVVLLVFIVYFSGIIIPIIQNIYAFLVGAPL